MELPVWGIAVIALCCLLQIPAVLFVARYCEVDPDDLPTPPMRAHWRSADPGEDAPDRPDRTAREEPSTPDREGPRTASPSGSPANHDGVRCGRCGTTNDPSFARCRRCVAQL